ncbi:MAG TPA: MBL fold metallo-hydrolase [Nitrospiria bacterium]|nr:MBL fold metallo-hydrolase [Nitrospiria bacterium]
MIVEAAVVGPFGCNCLVLGCEKSGEAMVVDPGDDLDRILEILERHRLAVRYILHTHAHLDHMGATAPLQIKSGGVACLHEGDLFLAESLSVQASLFGLPSPPTPTIDRILKDGEKYVAGEIVAEVLHTPGHTPGSVTFSLVGEEMLLTGDTLFAGSIGRTDLWGGSYEAILRSIHERLLTFPDPTCVFPGHGPKTTIGRERETNPYLQT